VRAEFAILAASRETSMRRFIYHGNFCSECGNALAPQRHWVARYLCDECAVHLRRANRLPARGWPWLLAASVAGLFYLFNYSIPNQATPNQASMPMPPAVKVVVAAPMPEAIPSVSNEAEPIFCGARTKRGTPCRRMVKSHDERCAQHRGKPSIASTQKP
jgi:hypothetical protein